MFVSLSKINFNFQSINLFKSKDTFFTKYSNTPVERKCLLRKEFLLFIRSNFIIAHCINNVGYDCLLAYC